MAPENTLSGTALLGRDIPFLADLVKNVPGGASYSDKNPEEDGDGSGKRRSEAI